MTNSSRRRDRGQKIWKWSGMAGAALVALAGCGPEPAADSIAGTESPIINGTPVSSSSAPTNPGTVAVYHAFVRPCSGTLIRRQWVLTARHCVTSDLSVFGPILPLSSVKVARATNPGLTPPAGAASATRIIGHDSVDIALIKISPEIAQPVGLADATVSSLSGTVLRAMGFGRNVDGGDSNMENGTSGAGTLRQADLTVSFVSSTEIDLATNGSGQQLWHGDSGGPSYKMTDVFGRSLPGIAGVHNTSDECCSSQDAPVDTNRHWIKQLSYSVGSFLGTPSGGVALTGGTGWASIPTLWADTESADEGGPMFFTTNQTVANFPSWAQDANAKAVSADFDGNGAADIALVGGTGWASAPVAFSTGGGNFNVTNVANSTLASITAPSDVRVTAGDIDGDGKGDIVVLRNGSSTVRVAFSLGAGSFFVTGGFNLGSNWSNVAGASARFVSGDFDGDGRNDLMLLGNSSSIVPMAFSNGSDGTFNVRTATSTLASWAQTSGVKLVVGDFNGDGRDDVALLGGSGWTDFRVAFSDGSGGFTTSQFAATNFPSWSQTAGVRMISSDFNGDGIDDIALTGGVGWASVPLAFGHGTSFFETNYPVSDFSSWAQTSGVKVLAGHN